MHTLFPWQTKPWQHLVTLVASERIPHALLFKGPQGIGKLHLVKTFAQLLLCLQPSATHACQQCKACHLFQANTHPDYQLLSIDAEQTVLKVDPIRDLIEFCNLSKQISARKVIVINTAEAMNTAAANAFLKTLEEPRPSIYIILLSHQPHLVAATIRSRCQQIQLTLPPLSQAIEWLKPQIDNQVAAITLLALAGSAPLQALANASNKDYLSQYQNFITTLINIALKNQEPISAITPWAKADPTTLLHWMCFLLLDIVRLQNQYLAEQLLNKEFYQPLSQLAVKIDRYALLPLIDLLNKNLNYLQQKLNLNFVLLLENLFCEWFYATHSD